MDEIGVRIHEAWSDGDTVRLFDLRPVRTRSLPAFTAGAHVDVNLPDGLVRQYSLVNDPGETHRYLVAVALDPASRGGSRHLVERAQAGDLLSISQPRTHFALDEASPYSVLLAGGIGVTPIWAMVQRLETLGRPWTLHYGARSPQSAALLGPIGLLKSRRDIRLYFESDSGARMDLPRIVAKAPPGAHLYCCGPTGMLAAYKAATADLPSGMAHFEQFTPAAPAAVEGGYVVKLARSGRTIPVRRGQSILDALMAHGVNVAYSCREGVCGSCETRVLEGAPDHRDAILSDDEKASGEMMMICCSGSLSPVLVLDR